MDRLALAVGIGAAALVVAWLVQRRDRPAAPVRTGYHVPDRLARDDFARPDAPWLVAVFTSATCSTCAEVWERARHLESDDVAVDEIELVAGRELHQRYRIDGVPLALVADAAGSVRASFLGPVTSAELWAAVAELREAG